MRSVVFHRSQIFLSILVLISFSSAYAYSVPTLDKTRYHTWEEVETYLTKISHSRGLRRIVKLIPIGYTQEGRRLNVLQISRKGVLDQHPDRKPATFIMGAHHANEHVSKEAVLALIDRILNGYGKSDTEGQAITYLVNAGTFYLLPWVNPDGGANAYFHNPYQRKTNSPMDEPQIGAAECDTCGDGYVDMDSPDLESGDVGIVGQYGNYLAYPNNGIISRTQQAWYEYDFYALPVMDQRADRIQPVGPGNFYTYNYEGLDPDADGLYSSYSGEDFVGGTDPNRNYGEPRWGDCAGDDGCSWKSGSSFYAGPAPFSEPETNAVASFLRSHPNIVSLESLHSGVNKIYPPDWIYPDDASLNTMDQSYQEAAAQYISQETGYEAEISGYASKGSTISYSYFGSSQDPAHNLDFFPGGVLSFVTEIYGMGTTTGSAEAIRDWFPNHYQQFNTNFPQGGWVVWPDFPFCTTCDPEQVPPEVMYHDWGIFAYLQFMEYFVFDSSGQCGGNTNPDIFHCDYWGMYGNTEYYADFDQFSYYNPPAANRCYSDWNCTGTELERVVDKQIKHLLYRLYIAPFLRINEEETTFDGKTLSVAIENTGFLRSSIQTTSRVGEEPFVKRYYDYGQVDVMLWKSIGFEIKSSNSVNIGWLGGGLPEDPEPNVKIAQYEVKHLRVGDSFFVTAGSEKTGWVTALMKVMPRGSGESKYRFETLWSNYENRSDDVDNYFANDSAPNTMSLLQTQSPGRSLDQNVEDINHHRKLIRRMERSSNDVADYFRGVQDNLEK